MADLARRDPRGDGGHRDLQHAGLSRADRHGNFGRVLVCNAGHVKNVPGRKTDLADADWLVHLLECGLLASSFIPPAEIKAARDVFRYRTKVAQQRVSEIARLGNVLQTPASRSTRWPTRSPPSPGGR